MDVTTAPSLIGHFFRFVIAGVFAVSVVAKLRNRSDFEETLAKIPWVPSALYTGLFAAVLTSEFLVVAGLMWDASVLYSFCLAIVLLLAFTSVLVWIVVNKIKTSCSCFGSNKKQVSWSDVCRNLVLLGIAVSGTIIYAYSGGYAQPHIEDMALAFVMAMVVTIVLIKADSIIDLLRN